MPIIKVEKEGAPNQKEPIRSRGSGTLSNIPTASYKKWVVIAVVLLCSSVIWIPLIQVLTGSFAKPNIGNEQDYIGYYQVRTFVRNDTGDFNEENVTFSLVNYYTDEIIGNITTSTNSLTTHHTTNVTMAYVINAYPYKVYNYTFVLQANSTQAHPFINYMYLEQYGSGTEFDTSIIAMNGVYGSYSMASITNANFSATIQFVNKSNHTLGYQNYIPAPFRQNENVSGSGLYMKVNVEVDILAINGIAQDIWYDDLGNTYMLFPSININGIVQCEVEFTGSATPTQISFIQGQVNDPTIITLS